MLSSLLIYIVLLFIVGQAEGDGLVVNLLTVVESSGSQGTILRRFGGSGYEEKEIKDWRLSTECGERLQRCSELLVIGSAGSSTTRPLVTAIPLVGGVGLVKFVPGRLSESELHFVDLTKLYQCSPALFALIEGIYFVVCSNSSLSIVRLLRLHIDAENLAVSNVPDYPDFPIFRNLRGSVTNFLLVELPSHSGYRIYFGSGYDLFYFNPTHLIVGQASLNLWEKRCAVTELAYSGEWELIVYCEAERALYVDLENNDVFHDLEFHKEGRPYVCPNINTYIGVFANFSFIQSANRTTFEAKNFEIKMSAYDNGVCLGFKDTTLFVFTDRERGTRLLNATGGFIKSLSESTCINYPCRPLVVLDDRYLILREKREGDWHISVLDLNSNLASVMEVSHSQANLMAVIDNVPDVEKPTTSINESAQVTNAQSDENSKGSSDLILPLVSTIAIAIAIAIFIGVTVAIYLLVRKRQKKYTMEPVQENDSIDEFPQPQPKSAQTQCVEGGIEETCTTTALRDDERLTTPEMPLTEERATKEARSNRGQRYRQELSV